MAPEVKGARLGIREQFILVMVVASLTFGIGVLALTRVLVDRALLENTRESYDSALNLLAVSIGDHLLTKELFEVRLDLFETVRRNALLQYLVVSDSDGRILSSSFGDHLPVGMEQVLDAVRDSEKGYVIVDENGRSLLHLRKALLGGQAGYLHAGIDRTPELRRSRTITRVLGILFLALTTVGLFVAIMMGRLITLPLREMAVMARRVGHGDLSGRMDVATRGEVGELASAFNAMKEELRDSREALIRTEKMAATGRLAAGVAHEIGNPLASLRACVWALRREDRNQEARARYLTALDQELKRIDKTVQSLLRFARPRRTDRRSARLRDVVERAVALVHPGIPKDRMRLEVEIDEELPEVWIDVDQMEQIVVNLMLNGIQAMTDGGGTLMVRLRREGGGQAISVEDDGGGIDSATLSKAFDPFFTTKDEGTGLGLSVSQAIVEAHGGRLVLSNRAPRGVRAEIILPAKICSTRPAVPVPASSTKGASG